jgi:hypothetical protein
MPFDTASLTGWGAMALLSVLGLRTPAQVEVPRAPTPSAVGATTQVGQAVLRKLNRG